MANCSWIGQAVSWILIIVGWVIVDSQNNKRETRKEVRASLLDLYKHLDAIEDAAFLYHSTTGDASEARKITRDIQQIAPRIVMARRGRMRVNYAQPLAAFRKAVTYENFDSIGFVSKKPHDQMFESIEACKKNLIATLESAFNSAYP